MKALRFIFYRRFNWFDILVIALGIKLMADGYGWYAVAAWFFLSLVSVLGERHTEIRSRQP